MDTTETLAGHKGETFLAICLLSFYLSKKKKKKKLCASEECRAYQTPESGGYPVGSYKVFRGSRTASSVEGNLSPCNDINPR